MKSNLVRTLAESEIFRDYERAFSAATGLPLSLSGPDSWQLVHQGKKTQNPFCEMMAETNCSCASCLEMQEKLRVGAKDSARTEKCAMGMLDSAVPVKLGSEVIGFLQTGQVFCRKPTAAQFSRIAKKLAGWGIVPDARVETAYFETKVMTPAQYASMVDLLTIFSRHLSLVANQVAVRQENAEAPMITRAKSFIKENQTEDLSLGQVAKAVNTSTFYFCKMFKKATGLNFTEYLSRVRVEKAKNLLLNPNLRVSEIAFEVGFQSLTHFNRVFRRIVGESPTDFRSHLRAG